jgi:hypothetical protein
MVRSLFYDPAARSLFADRPTVARDTMIELTHQAFDIQGALGRQLLVGIAEPGSAHADSLALLGSLHTAGRRTR